MNAIAKQLCKKKKLPCRGTEQESTKQAGTHLGLRAATYKSLLFAK